MHENIVLDPSVKRLGTTTFLLPCQRREVCGWGRREHGCVESPVGRYGAGPPTGLGPEVKSPSVAT